MNPCHFINLHEKNFWGFRSGIPQPPI